MPIRPNEGLSEGLNDNKFSQLNAGLVSLLAAISRNPDSKAKEHATLLGNRPLKRIEKQIADFTNKGLIDRKGSRKTGGGFS
jgi:hypothetical protein